MMAEPGSVLGVATGVAMALVLLGMVFAFVRMAMGPSLADRLVALDMLTVLMAAFAGVFAVASGEPVYLDAAIALALAGFLGTVALARYAERRVPPAAEQPPPERHPQPERARWPNS